MHGVIWKIAEPIEKVVFYRKTGIRMEPELSSGSILL
jgi:hypothetical protein